MRRRPNVTPIRETAAKQMQQDYLARIHTDHAPMDSIPILQRRKAHLCSFCHKQPLDYECPNCDASTLTVPGIKPLKERSHFIRDSHMQQPTCTTCNGVPLSTGCPDCRNEGTPLTQPTNLKQNTYGAADAAPSREHVNNNNDNRDPNSRRNDNNEQHSCWRTRRSWTCWRKRTRSTRRTWRSP